MRNMKKVKLKKKQIQTLFLILLAIFAYSAWASFQNKGNTQLTNEDFLRFHVVANSDSKEDQELKLKVRDGLLEKINEDLALEAMSQVSPDQSRATLDMEKSKEYITENLTEIEQKAKEIIRNLGYDYDAEASFGVKWIPRKTYGNVTFPAGNYQALNVTIGNGTGQNWWCVLFPPLCLIGAEVPSEMEDFYQDAIPAGKYQELMQAANGEEPKTLKLKFKTLEILK